MTSLRFTAASFLILAISICLFKESASNDVYQETPRKSESKEVEFKALTFKMVFDILGESFSTIGKGIKGIFGLNKDKLIQVPSKKDTNFEGGAKSGYSFVDPQIPAFENDEFPAIHPGFGNEFGMNIQDEENAGGIPDIPVFFDDQD